MPSLSALPERLATCVWRHAACPFGGPARCGPLSSEERFGGSVCQSFSLSVRAPATSGCCAFGGFAWKRSPDNIQFNSERCLASRLFLACGFPFAISGRSRANKAVRPYSRCKTKASRRAGASGSREAKHLGRHPGLMVAARTKPRTTWNKGRLRGRENAKNPTDANIQDRIAFETFVRRLFAFPHATSVKRQHRQRSRIQILFVCGALCCAHLPAQSHRSFYGIRKICQIWQMGDSLSDFFAHEWRRHALIALTSSNAKIVAAHFNAPGFFGERRR